MDYLGEFEQVVLIALLRLGDNAYGASVRREIEKRSGRRTSFSAVYTTLDRLERKGYLRSRLGEPTRERGGRRKKYYILQPAGLKVLSHSHQVFKRMLKGVERRLETS